MPKSHKDVVTLLPTMISALPKASSPAIGQYGGVSFHLGIYKHNATHWKSLEKIATAIKKILIVFRFIFKFGHHIRKLVASRVCG